MNGEGCFVLADAAVAALEDAGADSCFTAVPFHHFVWKRGDGGQALGVNHEGQKRKRRQELEPELENGAVFRIDYTPFSELLPGTDVCLTFSSTASLESLAAGITTGILTDIGINENVGNHFFIGSDLFVDFDQVTPDLERQVNRGWLEEHVPSGADALDRAAEKIAELVAEQERLGRALPIPNGRLFGRSEGYNRFLAELRGWRAVEQFGDPSYKVLWNQLNRAKRKLDPLRARLGQWPFGGRDS